MNWFEQRWPLHPEPQPLEALSSWIKRLAAAYDMTPQNLVCANLGMPTVFTWDSMDRFTPIDVLINLADRTGVDLDQIRAMTLAGWVPWLFDSLADDVVGGVKSFNNYVLADSVLLAGDARSRRNFPRRWRGPWLSSDSVREHRVCPVCARQSPQRYSLLRDLPLTISCPIHHCLLQDAEDVAADRLDGTSLSLVEVSAPLATLDGYTHRALLTGEVELPGRTVHAGIWFRLLRIVLDELTLAPSALGTQSRRTLEQLRDHLGVPPRLGVQTWRPYEQFGWSVQQRLLTAAAGALQLVAKGHLIANGSLAGVLAPARHERVYAGDRPPRTYSWAELTAHFDELLQAARYDGQAAQKALAILTAFDRSETYCRKQRDYLIRDCGVSPSHLSDYRMLVRFTDDLDRVVLESVSSHDRPANYSPVPANHRPRPLPRR
ncbi:MAG: TniQ family protein [Thermoguttaceae bacterium]